MPVEDYPVLDAVSISAEPGNAPAPENINRRVLKEVAYEIAPILALIYQLSIDAVKVPSDWKAANVSPIFKKGEQYYPANYRPVTLTSVLKLWSAGAHTYQHCHESLGIPPRSWETQVLGYTDEIFNNTAQAKQTDNRTDLQKLSTKVNYSPDP